MTKMALGEKYHNVFVSRTCNLRNGRGIKYFFFQTAIFLLSCQNTSV